MRARLLTRVLIATLAAGSALVLAPSAQAQDDSFYGCTSDLGFQYREDAQFLVDEDRFTEDPNYYGLDPDGNGVACDNPGNTLPNDPTPSYNSSPIGNLDFAAGITGGVQVRGWVADLDVPSWSGSVHVYVKGIGFVIPVAADTRGDVASAHQDYDAGALHGFSANLPISLPPGRHQLCVYGINYGPYSPNTTLGCQMVSALTPIQFSPVGALDPLQFFPDGRPVVYGWAADPEGITQPLQVHVYVDGRATNVLTTGNDDRPDVYRATGAPRAGFVGIVPAQGPGRHTVCVYGINIGRTGSNTLLGCRAYG